MRIGIDARLYNESGNGRYLRNLLLQLRLSDHDNSYVVFCLKKDYEAIKLVLSSDRWKIVVADFKWYTFAEQVKLPLLLYKEKLDLVHFPHFNVPILYLKRFVVTIHDLTHFTFAMKRATTHSWFTYRVKHQIYSFVFWYAVTWSQRVFTVSHYVKNEILRKFNCGPEKIIVTYEASEKPIPVTDLEINKILKKLHISGPFFLYVGNAHPHKNLEFLLHSFAELRKTLPGAELVLVGKESYFWSQLLEKGRRERLLDNVFYLGFLPDIELAALYSQAVSFVFPSLSEGFGLPVLESMAYGCPVICAERTSLPEVAGDAAVYIDPLNQDSFVRAMHMLYSSSDIRKERIQLGYSQVKKFSWEEMAKKTLTEYKKLFK